MPPTSRMVPANPAETCNNHGPDGIVPSERKAVDQTRLAFRVFPGNSQPQLEREVCGSLCRSQRGEGILGEAPSGKLACADCASSDIVKPVDMARYLLHLVAADRAVKIRGEVALNRCTRPRIHNDTPTRDSMREMAPIALSLSVASRTRNAARPRVSRDLTVPKIDLEDVGYLFVGKAFNLAQHYNGAKCLRHLAQRGFNTRVQFLLRGVVKG